MTARVLMPTTKRRTGADDMLCRTCFVLILTCTAVLQPAYAASAEFAIRWKSDEGGPADLQKAAELLGASGAPIEYSIRYFKAAKPPAPGMPEAIVRERIHGDKTEVTWKYRSTGGWASVPADGSDWCPLLGDKVKRKDEVDITVLDGQNLRRSHSRSCSTKGSIESAVARDRVGAQRGCTATMTRRENADQTITVEEWRLPNESAVFIEVSARGSDSDADLASFKRRIVAKLLAARIKPLDRSKTEIGTECR